MIRFRPDVSRRVCRVWRRNLAVYMRTWKINFLPPLLEPIFYIIAFGLGLAGFIGAVPFHGREVAYLNFITPALIAVAVMYNSFFETSYASFVRMHYQKTFEAMLATPLSLDEVITGEILWAVSRAGLSSLVMMAVVAPFGLLRWPDALLIPPLAIIGALGFASAGLFFTGILPNIESFNLPIFLFITPMFLLSGTFFPLEGLPWLPVVIAKALPLTHLTECIRRSALGMVDVAVVFSVLYLALFGLGSYLLALRVMRRRLIA